MPRRGDIINKTVKTVALVTVFSCVERFIGFIYRIFLSRNVDSELIGVYQVTLSVIGVLVTLSASGIPITVSRLMMKERALNDKKGEKEVVAAGILSSLLLSLPVTFLLYFFRDKFLFIFADQRCYDLLIIILPGVIITSVYAVIRGYFWGNENFFTYSLIELLEETVMAVLGVILVKTAASGWQKARGISYAVLLSYVFSFLTSTTVFLIRSGKIANPITKLKPLIKSSSPITAMRTLTSFLGSFVAVILPNKLIASGMEKSVAMASYGELSGMALPLLFIPSTIIGSIALVVAPKLSGSYYKKDNDSLNFAIRKSFDYSLLVATLIIPIFISCGLEIGKIIYDNENAGNYLATSAFIMLPMSLTMISNSLLNSLNQEKTTLLNFIFGAAAMIIPVLFLTKFFGVYSLIFGYLLSYALTGGLNFLKLSRITGEGKIYLKKTALFFTSLALSTLLGCFLKRIIANNATDFLTLIIITAATLIFNGIFLQTVGAVDVKNFFKSFLR